MLLRPAPVAQVLLDIQFTIVHMDHASRQLIGAGRDDVIGLPVADLLQPAERPMVAALLSAVLADGIPRTMDARWRYADGSAQRTATYVSRLGSGPDARLALASRAIAAIGTVATQWQIASLILGGLRTGRATFGTDVFSGPPAEILLILYLAEVEGRSMTAAAIAEATEIGWRLTQRWLHALVESGVIETERGAPVSAETALRLTADGDDRLLQMLTALESPAPIRPA